LTRLQARAACDLLAFVRLLFPLGLLRDRRLRARRRVAA